MSSDASKLPEIWEQRPPGSRSYEIRADVTVIPPMAIDDATVYWLRGSNRFYIQDDSRYSSTLHYFGPFEGDPRRMLGLGDGAD